MSGPGANKGSLKYVFNGKHGYKYIRNYIVLYCIVGLCICICHWLQIQIQSTIQKSWKQQIQGPPMCVEGMRVMQEMQSSRLVCLAVCKRCRQLLNGLLSFNPGADCKSLELSTHPPTAQNRLVRLPNSTQEGRGLPPCLFGCHLIDHPGKLMPRHSIIHVLQKDNVNYQLSNSTCGTVNNLALCKK